MSSARNKKNKYLLKKDSQDYENIFQLTASIHSSKQELVIPGNRLSFSKIFFFEVAFLEKEHIQNQNVKHWNILSKKQNIELQCKNEFTLDAIVGFE